MTTLTATQPTSVRTTDPGEVVVHAVALTKVFRDFWLRAKAKAVDGIHFDIRRGEVFGLLGPNGSGKSTTIKLTLGLLRPSAGKVVVFGKSPEDVATKKRIGYLPEDSYLYRFLNARETLDYYGRLFHLDATQRRQRIDKLLEMVGLEGVQRRAVGEYSKGMQRRIGLAQALINDPDLLILDEPTTGMDPIGTRQIKDLILELSRRGKTIILCSHLLSDVEDVCDRVAIMFGGKIRALGTTDELLTRQDKTTLEAPVLDGDTINAIEQLLEQRGKHLDRVQQPRQSLEAFFLDIVTQAQAEGAQTSGARNTGAIADFLADRSGATKTESVEPQRVLESLTQTTPPAKATTTNSANTTAAGAGIGAAAVAGGMTVASGAAVPTSPKVEEQVDESALADLMGSQWSKAEETPPPAPGSTQVSTSPIQPAGHNADAFEAPPTAEELAAINQLGNQWKNESDTPAPPPPPAPVKNQPTSQVSAKQVAGEGDEEKPDTSFLDALTQTPAYEEDEQEKKGDK